MHVHMYTYMYMYVQVSLIFTSLSISPFSPSLPLSSEQSSPANECLGMDYLVQAAERGMKLAMLEVARAFESGVGLGTAPEGDTTFPAKQRCTGCTLHIILYMYM